MKKRAKASKTPKGPMKMRDLKTRKDVTGGITPAPPSPLPIPYPIVKH